LSRPAAAAAKASSRASSEGAGGCVVRARVFRVTAGAFFATAFLVVLRAVEVDAAFFTVAFFVVFVAPAGLAVFALVLVARFFVVFVRCSATGLPSSVHNPLRRRQALEAHGPVGMQLRRGDSDLGAEAQLAAI